jgi:hypothetical protein
MAKMAMPPAACHDVSETKGVSLHCENLDAGYVIDINMLSRLSSDPGAAACHDVLETKGVISGMGKTLQQSMSLKLRYLAVFAGAWAAKKIPPKIGERSRNVIENKRRKNFRFPPCHEILEKKRVKGFLPRC